MGIRGLIRDIIGIYLGLEIIRSFVYKNSQLSVAVVVAAVILLALSIWFVLERFGALPRLT